MLPVFVGAAEKCVYWRTHLRTSSLENIYLSDTLTAIPNNAFYGCIDTDATLRVRSDDANGAILGAYCSGSRISLIRARKTPYFFRNTVFQFVKEFEKESRK